MKIIILFLCLSIGTITKASAQKYKMSFLSFTSETKDEMDGYSTAIGRFKSCIVTINSKNKSLLITGSNDAVVIRFFKELPWDAKNKMYVAGFYYGNNSYYVQATINKDFQSIKMNFIYRNEETKKVTDDMIILFKRTK